MLKFIAQAVSVTDSGIKSPKFLFLVWSSFNQLGSSDANGLSVIGGPCRQ